MDSLGRRYHEPPFPISILSYCSGAGATLGWAPVALFVVGEIGLLYDPLVSNDGGGLVSSCRYFTVTIYN